MRGITRSFAEKLQDAPTVNDFVQPGDNGDFAPAIERAAAQGVRSLILTSRQTITLKRTVRLPHAGLNLRCENKSTEIRLLEAADTYFDVGNDTSVTYTFSLDGCVFTKENVSNSGAILRMRNVFLWDFHNIRVFGQYKIWRVLDLTSVARGTSRDVDIGEIREKAINAYGGTATPGYAGQPTIDNTFVDWYVSHANGFSTTPSQGAVYFDDNFTANWFFGWKAVDRTGCLLDLRGTLANRGNNGLNILHNLNAEASKPGDGVVCFGAVVGSQIAGPGSWISTYGAPAIRLGADSLNNIVRGYQIGVSEKYGGR